MEQENAVVVSNLSKAFRLPHERYTSTKQWFVNAFRGERGYEVQTVLDDVSFEIKKGEFYGIVGRNGSGKSTLLKLLAGIYAPDSGQITLNGTLTPFIELGVGFNMELTGRENVFMNGALLGFSRREMEAMYDDIVEFAELRKFMDQKLKNYSSGMQVRLAFSIAIRSKSDILLLDEVLAVGDAGFQKKCFEHFAKLKAMRQTVVFVSHAMDKVKEYCDRAILLEGGKKVIEGTADEVVSAYNQLNLADEKKEIAKFNTKVAKRLSGDQKAVAVRKIWTENSHGKTEQIFQPKEKITICCEVEARQSFESLSLVLRCNNPGGVPIFAISSRDRGATFSPKASERFVARWTVENIFNNGSYLVSALILDKDAVTVHDQALETYKFEIHGWQAPSCVVHTDDDFAITLKK